MGTFKCPEKYIAPPTPDGRSAEDLFLKKMGEYAAEDYIQEKRAARIIIAVILIIYGFLVGIFLAFATHSAKAMDYDAAQAIELLAMPMDEYQPEAAALESIMPEPATTYLGTYTVTAYCPCEICCGKWSNPDNPKTASSTTPTELITVGADWDELVPGTTIYIDGVGERIVEDKVAGWVADKYDGKVLDLYYFDHSDALAFGKSELDVWEVKKEVIKCAD